MIRITVALISAIDGSQTELARMDICNDGKATGKNHRVGDYDGCTYRGRSTEQLDKLTVSKVARVENWRRNDFHVWNLVRLMLERMGYTQGVK